MYHLLRQLDQVQDLQDKVECFNRGLLIFSALYDLVQLIEEKNTWFRKDYTFDGLIVNFQILRRLEAAIKNVDFTQLDFADNARRLHSVKDYHYEEFVMPEKIPELPSPKSNPLRHPKQ